MISMAVPINHLEKVPDGVDRLITAFIQKRRWELKLVDESLNAFGSAFYIRGWFAVGDDFLINIELNIAASSGLHGPAYEFTKQAFFAKTRPPTDEIAKHFKDAQAWVPSPVPNDYNRYSIRIEREYDDPTRPFLIKSRSKEISYGSNLEIKCGWGSESFFRRIFELVGEAVPIVLKKEEAVQQQIKNDYISDDDPNDFGELDAFDDRLDNVADGFDDEV